MKRILCSMLIAAVPYGSALAQAPTDKTAKVTLVAEHELPNVPGKSLRAVLVEYGPGAGSPSHRHPASAFIYARVLEGAIRSKVNDAPEVASAASANTAGAAAAAVPWVNAAAVKTADNVIPRRARRDCKSLRA